MNLVNLQSDRRDLLLEYKRQLLFFTFFLFFINCIRNVTLSLGSSADLVTGATYLYLLEILKCIYPRKV